MISDRKKAAITAEYDQNRQLMLDNFERQTELMRLVARLHGQPGACGAAASLGLGEVVMDLAMFGLVTLEVAAWEREREKDDDTGEGT